jgi:hypothetical protein
VLEAIGEDESLDINKLSYPEHREYVDKPIYSLADVHEFKDQLRAEIKTQLGLDKE